MSASKKKKTGPSAGDDRNIVIVNQGFAEADFEDRAWLLWEKYKALIILAGVGIFVGGIALIARMSYGDSKSGELAGEYFEATTPQLQMDFAGRNAGEPIAALAALEAADASYAKADYKEAASRYATAITLGDAAKSRDKLVLNRAIIGAAISEIRSGNAVAGLARLNAVADDITRDPPARAHAAFLLAEHACGERDFAKAKQYLDRIDRDMAAATGWNSPYGPKGELIRSFPELLAASAAPKTPAPVSAAK